MSTPEEPVDAIPTPPRAQYEFDARQNETIAGLSRDMRWVAAPLLIVGALYAVAFILGIVDAFRHPQTSFVVLFILLATLFYLALGIWTQKASTAFQQIAETTGRDISHLMDALENLRKQYSLLSLIIKIYVAIILIALIAAGIAAILGAFKG